MARTPHRELNSEKFFIRWRLNIISDEFPEMNSLANYKMKNGGIMSLT